MFLGLVNRFFCIKCCGRFKTLSLHNANPSVRWICWCKDCKSGPHQDPTFKLLGTPGEDYFKGNPKSLNFYFLVIWWGKNMFFSLAIPGELELQMNFLLFLSFFFGEGGGMGGGEAPNPKNGWMIQYMAVAVESWHIFGAIWLRCILTAKWSWSILWTCASRFWLPVMGRWLDQEKKPWWTQCIELNPPAENKMLLRGLRGHLTMIVP